MGHKEEARREGIELGRLSKLFVQQNIFFERFYNVFILLVLLSLLMAKKHVEKMSTELAGLYAVASELCKEGYLVTVAPSGHYPAIDLIIHDLKEDRFTGLQVKTRTFKKVDEKWYFKPSRAQPTVFVKLGKETLFHVLDRKSVAQMTNEAEQWIHKKNIERSDTKDNWDNIWK